eukprot:TRINITY_DN21386_c0_g1_i1.p1 TRINITY_DN21386_c0_g1~~TRINITY_DN21386_c0_g1_i1.p1  ORF type:complete len:119 (+),score=18.82 TRINITY_DN21386_c0_g1_i1:43-399(+)
MLRSTAFRLVSLTSEHHPSFKATARKISNTFLARMEVEKVNKEITRLLIIRDKTLNSEFHVARPANGMFELNPYKRVQVTDEVLCLRRRKLLLLNYIKRAEAQNAEIKKQQKEAETAV